MTKLLITSFRGRMLGACVIGVSVSWFEASSPFLPMPAVVRVASPDALSPRLTQLAWDAAFVHFVHYVLGLEEIPEGFLALIDNSQPIQFPDWFDNNCVSALRRAGYSITYQP